MNSSELSLNEAQEVLLANLVSIGMDADQAARGILRIKECAKQSPYNRPRQRKPRRNMSHNEKKERYKELALKMIDDIHDVESVMADEYGLDERTKQEILRWYNLKADATFQEEI